jgi:ADP-heptose:LPS heptosyltransferase|tara:strand:+ start:584 stop:1504 length:921 start_codon:yes stop_codon:yes gene_type:complete
MKKVFVINGGAGRVLCAIPALLKYYKNNGPNFYILTESGLDFFAGIPNLQDLTFTPEHKGVFENIIKPNELISPEPYREHAYYNQQRHLTEAFDYLINGTPDHTDLEKIKIVLNKTEEINAIDAIVNVKSHQGKEKTIVIQPFGRSSTRQQHEMIDPMSRSISLATYQAIIKELHKTYNVVYMGENKDVDDTTFKVDSSLRQWAAIIEASDYFLGCDSVGQHMAYAFNKPGTIILGSTFAENTSYANHFQILRKPNTDIRYFPIRLCENGIDGDIANRVNDTCMDFSEKETKELISKILKDIKEKV